MYHTLFADRVVFMEFNFSDVADKIAGCEKFLSAIRPLIKTLEEDATSP
ncbi:MAG TPA: hypothetical protein VNK46_12815 [Nitrospiraceae bacterium]|nr:hypothetical protein [Nitrospiraceae bacterium]